MQTPGVWRDLSFLVMSPTMEWLTSTEVARRFRVSRNTLIRLRHEGVLQAGVEYITQGQRTIWDAVRTEQALRDYSRRLRPAQVGETYSAESE